MSYVWMVVIGFVAGLIARALHPGDDKLGFILTALLGIAGSLLANFIGQAVGWYEADEKAGFVASIIGAIVLLAIYSFIKKRGSCPHTRIGLPPTIPFIASFELA